MVTNAPKDSKNMRNMKSSKEEEQAAELSIITGIKRLGVDDCLERLEDMCQSWRLYETTATFESQVISMFGALDVNFDDDLIEAVSADRGYFGLREVNDKIKKAELEAMTLFHRLRELNMLPTKNDDNETHHASLKKITKILEMIFYTKKVVLSSYQAKIAVHQLAAEEGIAELNPDIDSVLGSWNLRFRMVGDDVSQFQELLLYLLDSAMENGYRKQDGFLYEPIVIDGRNMHSYRQVYEIKEFVYSRLRKEISFEHWAKGTQNMKNISSAVEYLTNCHDTQLPVLHKSRGTYAFTNGVYIASEDRFHCFETSETPLSDSVVACKVLSLIHI